MLSQELAVALQSMLMGLSAMSRVVVDAAGLVVAPAARDVAAPAVAEKLRGAAP
jgi:hypothetical protein